VAQADGSVTLCTTSLSPEDKEAVAAAVLALPGARLVDAVDGRTSLLVAPQRRAPRTEKVALAACCVPHIVSCAYLARCVAAGAWLPVQASDVPVLDLDAADAPGNAVDLHAVLSARPSLPTTPLSGQRFAISGQLARKPAVAGSIRAIIAAGGGRVLEVTPDTSAGVLVLADPASPLDRVGEGFRAAGSLYDYRIVVTAMVRQAVTEADKARYRVRAPGGGSRR
jgi:hypothetical protein